MPGKHDLSHSGGSTSADPATGRYVFDSAGHYGENRFQLLSELFDRGTVHHLQSTGVGPGWHCLEAGAGGGSIARWLAQRVGSTGRVLATDLDTTLLQRVGCRTLEVQRHNLITDPLPEQAFDLVHCRLLLMHLPKRDQALAKLTRAAKPGGWIMLEEFDSLSLPAHASVPNDETTLKITAAFRQYLFSRGVDLGYGRRLASLMRSRGLENVRAEGSLSMWQGGSVGARFVKATYQELREALLQTGALSEQEFERDLEKLDDRGFICPSPIMWTAAGRRSDALR